MRPMNADGLDFGLRDTYRRPIFATSVELFNWAATITQSTQEGEPYHDALQIWEDTCELIANLFNGTQTFVNPFTGETQNYPELLDQDDVQRMMVEDFNTRLISWPLYPIAALYSDDNNQEWYEVLTKWSHRIERFVKSQGERYLRMLKVLALEYNPLSDYWIQKTELGANAPYVSQVMLKQIIRQKQELVMNNLRLLIILQLMTMIQLEDLLVIRQMMVLLFQKFLIVAM